MNQCRIFKDFVPTFFDVVRVVQAQTSDGTRGSVGVIDAEIAKQVGTLDTSMGGAISRLQAEQFGGAQRGQPITILAPKGAAAKPVYFVSVTARDTETDGQPCTPQPYEENTAKNNSNCQSGRLSP